MQMTLEDILKAQGLTDEQIAKIVADMKENKIYTSSEENIDERYSKLKEQKEGLEAQVSSHAEQLEELKSKASGSDELKKQIQTLQDINEATQEEYESKLEEQNFNYALEVALRDSKVKNSKAVQALLDKDSIKLDGDKLLGLDEQIKTLKESDSYLFEEKEPKNTGNSGNFGRQNQGGQMTKEEFNSLGYKERVELKNKDEELYNTLIERDV